MSIKRHLRRRVDHVRVESCPLHTERPEWALKAPAQVEAACKRGAHVIGLTEVHTHLAEVLGKVAADNGYLLIHDKGDTALLVKHGLANLNYGSLPVEGTTTFYSFVSFDFHGRRATVYAFHWLTLGSDHTADRQAQTEAAVAAMNSASKGPNISFLVADANPSKPLHFADGEPQHGLTAAGMLLVWDELETYPTGVGVTTIVRNSADTSVKAESVTLSDPLGSDHAPGTAVYAVKRRLFRR